jgi:hypothetical protein
MWAGFDAKDLIGRGSRNWVGGSWIRNDGGGLYLWLFPDGKKYWRMRYGRAGKEPQLKPGCNLTHPYYIGLSLWHK